MLVAAVVVVVAVVVALIVVVAASGSLSFVMKLRLPSLLTNEAKH